MDINPSEVREAIESELSILLDNNQFERMIPLLDALWELPPIDLNRYFLIRGYCLWQLDRNEEAIFAYTEATKYDPANPVPYNNMGTVFLDDLKDPCSAMPLYERAIELNPDYRLAYFNLGRCYELLENTIEAAKTYTHALGLEPLDDEQYIETDISDEIRYRIHNLFKV